MFAPTRLISPPAATAAMANTPASIRSDITVCSTAGQLGHAVHGDEAGAAAGDLRAHLGEERDHVEHFRLLRRVVDDRRAWRERRRHHQVLGAGVRRRVQVQVRAAQAVGSGDPDDRLALVDGRAEPGEPAVVEVKVPAAEVAAADALDDGLAEPVQQRGHEEHRAAEAAGDLRWQHRRVQRRGVYHECALGLVELNPGADRLGELDGAVDVLDRRDVPQHGATLIGQQGRCDHLQGRVLRALDEHRALQRRSAANTVADLGALGHVDTAPVRGGTARTAHSVSAPERTRCPVCHPMRVLKRGQPDERRRRQAARRSFLRGMPGQGRPHPAPCSCSYPA